MEASTGHTRLNKACGYVDAVTFSTEEKSFEPYKFWSTKKLVFYMKSCHLKWKINSCFNAMLSFQKKATLVRSRISTVSCMACCEIHFWFPPFPWCFMWGMESSDRNWEIYSTFDFVQKCPGTQFVLSPCRIVLDAQTEGGSILSSCLLQWSTSSETAGRC